MTSHPPRQEPKSFFTRNGERVPRTVLEEAILDPKRVGLGSGECAQSAMDGDADALEVIHANIGIALPGVTEHHEGMPIRLTSIVPDAMFGMCSEGENPHGGRVRAAFEARAECGWQYVSIDAIELIDWIHSAEGMAALARRGVTVPRTIHWSRDKPPLYKICLVTISQYLPDLETGAPNRDGVPITKMTSRCVTVAMYRDDGFWIDLISGQQYCDEVFRVIEWAPLPEPSNPGIQTRDE